MKNKKIYHTVAYKTPTEKQKISHVAYKTPTEKQKISHGRLLNSNRKTKNITQSLIKHNKYDKFEYTKGETDITSQRTDDAMNN
jgi:hypothetical protein